MAEMLLDPVITAESIDRARPLVRPTPATTAFGARNLFYAKTYGPEHPVTRAAYGPTTQSVASIGIDDVRAMHQRVIHSRGLSLVIVGDVTVAEAVRVAGRYFGTPVGVASPADASLPAPLPRSPTTIYLWNQPAARDRTTVYVGHVTSLDAPDYDADLDVLSRVLGTGTSSRIVRTLRDRLGLVYDATPFTVSWRGGIVPALLYGIATAQTDSIGRAVAEWLRELREIDTTVPPTAEEVRTATAVVASAPKIQLQTVDAVANRIAVMVADVIPFDAYARADRRLRAVTPASLTAVAQRFMDDESLVIVVAGPRDRLEPRLRAANLGPVVVVDERGRVVP
jgi:zinc protease